MIIMNKFIQTIKGALNNDIIDFIKLKSCSIVSYSKDKTI